MSNQSENRSRDALIREQNAPRLAGSVPRLCALQIAIEEKTATASSRYRKHVVVRSAPALFVIHCGDERCQDGGHDITYEVMRALHAGVTRSTGHSLCSGTTGTSGCTRQITYEMQAQYIPTN